VGAAQIFFIDTWNANDRPDMGAPRVADNYVTKPYSPMQLLRVIRGYLRE
jgi:DNA-binding response OmpR family regulator